MPRTRVKVCCIADPHEAQLAVAAGADAVGLVGAMPSGPGPIDDASIRAIADLIPPPVATFLLTSRVRGRDIADHAAFCRTDTVQIVNHIDPTEYEILRRLAPEVRRVQVIHVEDASALALIDTYAPYVHAFLLDSGRPHASVAELGGTGRTHDWHISRRCVAHTDKPIFLAGGLNPDNVGAAIRQVQPYAVDLCSGVRTAGQLDAAKLRAFMAQI